jgi:hypothetical protein
MSENCRNSRYFRPARPPFYAASPPVNMRKLLAMLLFAGALCVASAPAAALKLDSDKDSSWRLLLTGPINTGDAERFVRTLLEPLAERPLLVSEVILNSPGGNLAEALRLASLVRGLHLDTRIRAGGACSSACFFVFLAGDQHLPIEHNNGSARPGRIGLHRPYLAGDAMKKGDPMRGMERQQAEMGKIIDYLRKESVPLRLIDEMMTHPSNDIYWMSDEDLWQLGEYHPGLEEVLIARCGYDKRLTSPAYEKLLAGQNDDARAKGEEQLATLLQCIASTRASFDGKRDAFLAKLKTGWRPWTETSR